MISIQRGLLLDKNIFPVIGKFTQVGGIGPKAAYHVVRWARELSKVIKEVDMERLEIVKRNHDGKETNELSAEAKAALDKEMLEFLMKEVDINITKVPFSTVEKVDLTPFELSIVDKLIELE